MKHPRISQTDELLEELLAHSVLMSDDSLRIRVLDIETLIAVKQRVARPKDKFVLPILIAMRRRQQEQQ